MGQFPRWNFYVSHDSIKKITRRLHRVLLYILSKCLTLWEGWFFLLRFNLTLQHVGYWYWINKSDYRFPFFQLRWYLKIYRVFLLNFHPFVRSIYLFSQKGGNTTQKGTTKMKRNMNFYFSVGSYDSFVPTFNLDLHAG